MRRRRDVRRERGRHLIGVTALTLLRRFDDKDAKLTELDLLPSVEGWNRGTTGAVRQVTLAVRLPREHGEAALVEALEAEPGITRMQLDPVS